MAQPAYSHRLAEALVYGASHTQALFTVPAAKVAVVRSIAVYCWTAPGLLQLKNHTGPIWADFHLATVSSQFVDGLRWVVNAGETIDAINAQGEMNVTVHGYLLDA